MGYIAVLIIFACLTPFTFLWGAQANYGNYFFGGLSYAMVTMIIGIFISIPYYLHGKTNTLREESENQAKIERQDKKGLEDRIEKLEKELNEDER